LDRQFEAVNFEIFLMIKEGGGADQTVASTPQVIVVQHWVEELKRLVPTN
jgi:hypothetical protein